MYGGIWNVERDTEMHLGVSVNIKLFFTALNKSQRWLTSYLT
jgi:hypothetical protein